jgi:hypothetical protein
MSRARRADPELDGLIAEITVDCYDEEEALMGFANAFEDIRLPCRGSVVGEEVEVLSVGESDGRRELVATCERAGDAMRSHCSTSISTPTRKPRA